MNYTTMMRECAAYIAAHRNERMTAESLGAMFSYPGNYFGYLFSAFFDRPIDWYLKESGKERRMPKEDEIKKEYLYLKEFLFLGEPLSSGEETSYDPLNKAAEEYNENFSKGKADEPCLYTWRHDEFYQLQYLKGKAVGKKNGESGIEVPFLSGTYLVFSVKANGDRAEAMKKLVHYVNGTWMPKNREKYDALKNTFQCHYKEKVYYGLPIASEEETEEKVYGVDAWTKYIDEHITSDLSTSILARKFCYSETHLKRIFRCYYKMSVSDYVRKRRLHLAAEKIRNGEPCKDVAVKYKFKTYAGFSRAFQKEFHMTPAAYGASTFEVVNLADYYREYKDSLRITYLESKELKMIGRPVLKSRSDDADLPAQVSFWLNRDFPCLENTRFSCNVERREDKLALWHQMEEWESVEYILGPIVEEFEEDIPEEMIKVTVEGGKYAMFQTEKESDKENVAETLRMFFRCVHYGWIKEHRDYVDLSRVTFERYVDNKIYLYVPIR